jgi:transcription termination factor NusB
VLDEAIELAKTYGATDSYRFVNALLDKARQSIPARSDR